MEKAILLAIAASLCTATASVCQRLGASSNETTGFDVWLVFRLARRPVWLLGVASMILGFAFQLSALHYGALTLVQPILALELLFVFGYLAVVGSWWLAGLVTSGVVLLALAVALGPGNGPGASRARRAAVLGAVTGISWGFVAAVIKELSSHLRDGLGAIFSSWSPYVLIAVGAAAMLLASHAMAAGPLAASQPGFTILDPLAASLLGVFLFGEHIRTGVFDLAGQALALAVVMAGATALSHSCLILGADGDPSCLPAGYQAQDHREQLQKLTLEYQPADAPHGPAGNRPTNPATRSPQL